METESGTDIPRLHFPPMVLALRDWNHGQLACSQRPRSNSYSFVPGHELFGELIEFGMVEEVLNELREDGFEFLESGGFRHCDVSCW